MAYLLQTRALEREALALRAQAPFMDGDPPSVASVIEDFDAWLISGPPDLVADDPRDAARRDMDEAMGIVRGRR